MTLSRALGHIDPRPPEDQYRVSLFDRLRAIGYDEEFTLGADSVFEFKWSGGYEETFHRDSPNTGSLRGRRRL